MIASAELLDSKISACKVGRCRDHDLRVRAVNNKNIFRIFFCLSDIPLLIIVMLDITLSDALACFRNRYIDAKSLIGPEAENTVFSFSVLSDLEDNGIF